MLSARYLHLHEALGLGPMWLKQAAAVLPPKNTPATPAQARPQTVRAATIRPSQPHNVQARLETMKALETAAVHTRKPAPETETPPPGLSDGIAPVPAASGITKLAVVSLCPPIEDAVYGQLFHGKAGILLDNILKAAGLDAAYVHKTCWVKPPPSVTRCRLNRPSRMRWVKSPGNSTAAAPPPSYSSDRRLSTWNGRR